MRESVAPGCAVRTLCELVVRRFMPDTSDHEAAFVQAVPFQAVAAALDRDRELLRGRIKHGFLHARFAATDSYHCGNERDALVEDLPVHRERGIGRFEQRHVGVRVRGKRISLQRQTRDNRRRRGKALHEVATSLEHRRSFRSAPNPSQACTIANTIDGGGQEPCTSAGVRNLCDSAVHCFE